MSLEKRRYNILCLSGGGYRGLFTAALLRNIQRGYRLPGLANQFDLIIGTSTGGLIATALACGLPPEAIVKAFETHGPRIFPSRSRLRRLYRSLTFRSQYNPARTRAAVHAMLGEKAHRDIEDLDAPLALVAVSTVEQKHRVFAANPFADRGIAPTPIIDAVLATTAAPTYFPEHNITLDRLIDGGLAANAPVLVGIAMLRRKLALPAEKIHVLHIGTAAPARSASFAQDERSSFGPLAWWRRAMKTRDLVHLTLNAQELLATYVADAWIDDRYVYVDASDRYRQGEDLMSLDNASVATTAKLKWLAEETWKQWQEEPALRSFFDASPPVLVAQDQPVPTRRSVLVDTLRTAKGPPAATAYQAGRGPGPRPPRNPDPTLA